MIHAGRGSDAAIARTCSRKVRALAKNRGASKRKMTQPGSRDGVRVAAHVVVPGEAGDAAEDRLVRPPGPAEDVADREGDRQRDAGEDAEQHDAEEGGHAEQELRAAHPAEPQRLGDVRQRQRRRDHDRGEGRLGQVLEQAGEEQQDERDRHRAHQARELGLRPGLLGDGRA